MTYAEFVTKLTAVCMHCGAPLPAHSGLSMDILPIMMIRSFRLEPVKAMKHAAVIAMRYQADI